MFIELNKVLHVLDGKYHYCKILFDINLIVAILPHPDKENSISMITFGNGDSFVVKESYDEVKRLISLTGRREVSKPLV